MTTTLPPIAPPTEPTLVPRDATSANRQDPQLPISSTPVEMSRLSSKPSTSLASTTNPTSTQATNISPQTSTLSEEKSLPQPAIPAHTSTTNPPSSAQADARPDAMSRTFTTAIGPSSDSPMPIPKDESTGPTLLITLLLTTGARHPFKLDPKYLSKRNVEVQGNDPFNLSVYKLKELILREWRDEWEQKPSSPSSIRLISFGKLLDDKAPLKDSKFNREATNVVHMTVKPQDYVDEEDQKGSKSGLGSSGEAHERSPGCRCVIM